MNTASLSAIETGSQSFLRSIFLDCIKNPVYILYIFLLNLSNFLQHFEQWLVQFFRTIHKFSKLE